MSYEALAVVSAATLLGVCLRWLLPPDEAPSILLVVGVLALLTAALSV